MMDDTQEVLAQMTFDEEIKSELKKLLLPGNVGFYSHCEIIQAVLISNDKKIAQNYFTNIEFNQSIDNCIPSQLLGEKLFSISKNYKLAITKYSIKVEDFINLYLLAYKTQLWTYRDEKIDSDVILDHVFPTEKKYIPSNDPTGGQYNLVVPFERSLYGTNFNGDYYICELYSQSKTIAFAVSEVEHSKIREIFNKLHLTFDLCKLKDRLGNIVCKFNVETITSRPKKLSAENGISFELARSDKCMFPDDFEICFFQEHDHMIYGHWNKKIVFDKNGKYIFEIAPNQCKNTIFVTNLSTGLMSFMAVYDYSAFSNYFSQITPPYVVAHGYHDTRQVIINGKTVNIPLPQVEMIGNVNSFYEMSGAEKRQQLWYDKFLAEQRYFIAYTKSTHETAINDIRMIINGQLKWDLKEIFLIDPYLMPKDILETVVYCEKKGIKIKCLTDLRSIEKNVSTRCFVDKLSDKDSKTRFDIAKIQFQNELEDAIPFDTDMQLEYRTVHGEHGMGFHDRYLIMKFNLNKTRAWSLGISVNSLGRSHHIIQIVETPELIANIFDGIWQKTDVPECVIFKTRGSESVK